MVYRIRFTDGPREAEAFIEAHNTTEALVKFCHTRGEHSGDRASEPRVTSVCQEAQEELLLEES